MQWTRLTLVASGVLLSAAVAGVAPAQYRQRCSDECFAKNTRCFKTCDRTDPANALNCRQPCYAAVDTCYAACMQPPRPVVAPPASRNWRVPAPPAAATTDTAPRDFICKTCR